MKLLLISILATLAVAGCSSFTGATHVPKGAEGYRANCQKLGLDFAGMVLMGNYTDGCICHERGQQVSLTDVSGAAGAVVAVTTESQNAGIVAVGGGPH